MRGGLVEPMEVVSAPSPGGPVLCEVQSVTPTVLGAILTVRQIDSDVYADKDFPTPITRDPGPSTPGTDPGLSLVASGAWGRTVGGRAYDVTTTPGEDVERVFVSATWRDTDPASTTADVVYGYWVTFAVGARGVVTTHRVQAQAVADPIVSDPAVGAAVFGGDAGYELEVLLTPYVGDVPGRTVELLAPAVPTATTAVTIVGQPEAGRLGSAADGSDFSGWFERIRVRPNVEGTLVYSFDPLADAPTWTAPSTNTTHNINQAPRAQEPGVIQVFIRNTFNLDVGQNFITFGVQAADGTVSLGDGTSIKRSAPPEYATYLTKTTPTGVPRGFEGQETAQEEEE